MEPKLSVSSIKKASYAELTQLCKKLDVTFQNQPKEKLQELLIAKITPEAQQEHSGEKVTDLEAKNEATIPQVRNPKKAIKKIIQAKPGPVIKADNTKKAVKNTKETKSSRILALHLKGMDVAAISKKLDAHPSFCYTIIGKYKGKK